MNNESLVKEIQLKKDLETVINKYIKDIPALHILIPMQQACAQLQALSNTQIKKAMEDCNKLNLEVEEDGKTD